MLFLASHRKQTNDPNSGIIPIGPSGTAETNADALVCVRIKHSVLQPVARESVRVRETFLTYCSLPLYLKDHKTTSIGSWVFLFLCTRSTTILVCYLLVCSLQEKTLIDQFNTLSAL